MKHLPETASELLDAVAQVHNLDCLCQNYKTWIEEYAEKYGHTNGTIQEFFGNVMDYLDYNPELINNIIFSFETCVFFSCSFAELFSYHESMSENCCYYSKNKYCIPGKHCLRQSGGTQKPQEEAALSLYSKAFSYVTF